MAVQPERDLGDRNPAAFVDHGEYRNEGLLAPWPTVHNANEIPAVEDGVQGQILDTGFPNPPLFATPREELGSTVPQSIKEKIWKGDFLELGCLFKNAPIQSDHTPMVLTFSGSTLQLQPQRKVPRITSIEQWTCAFLVYASVYAERHVSRARELFKYMDVVRSAARFPGYGWRAYDTQFRLRQEREPTRSWAVVDSELWLMTAAAPYMQQPISLGNEGYRRTNFRLPGQSSPESSRGGSSANGRIGTGRTYGSRPGGRRICFSFNSGQCVRKQCQ